MPLGSTKFEATLWKIVNVNAHEGTSCEHDGVMTQWFNFLKQHEHKKSFFWSKKETSLEF